MSIIMAALVTGAKGIIGSKLVAKLGACHTIDLRDGQNLATCDLPKDIDVIYHLAAQSSVESSWHDPVQDMQNLAITARLVKEYPNARIIYANSAASVDPVSPYGFSKKVSGDYLRTFHKDYVDCVFPNVYGTGRSVVDIFKESDEITIYGDGEQVRDYVHIDDIVQGLLKAQKWPIGRFEMGSTIPTTVLQLAYGKKANYAPARQEARESVLRNDTPDWSPTIDVLEYIK